MALGDGSLRSRAVSLLHPITLAYGVKQDKAPGSPQRNFREEAFSGVVNIQAGQVEPKYPHAQSPDINHCGSSQGAVVAFDQDARGIVRTIPGTKSMGSSLMRQMTFHCVQYIC